MEQHEKIINIPDCRVAVIGNVDSGKSTIIGVLTSGVNDDGRGSARKLVFRYPHEGSTGRTSAIGQHILGFDEKNEPIYQTVAASASSQAKSKSWSQLIYKSQHYITFIDLAGHEKYLKCAISGLTGSYPDYSMLVVGANMGISKMTKEHLGVSIALEIPTFVVVTKIDMAPPEILENTLKVINKILKSPAAKKMPIIIRNMDDVLMCCDKIQSGRITPIFQISSVEGTNLDLLYYFLSRLQPRPQNEFGWRPIIDNEEKKADPNPIPSPMSFTLPLDNQQLILLSKQAEFDIEEIFNVSGVGIVVSGIVKSGIFTNTPQQIFFLGPFPDGSFIPITIRSIQIKRITVPMVKQYDSCAMAIRSNKKKMTLKREMIHRGMVILAELVPPGACFFFSAEILIFTHSTTIKTGYQCYIHCGNIRQTATMVSMNKDILRTGERANVRFQWKCKAEYLHTGRIFIFREGNTKGIGKVLSIEGLFH